MKKNFFILASALFVINACSSEKKEEKADKDKIIATSTESQEEKNKITAMASINAVIVADIDGAVKDAASDSSVVDYGDGSTPPVLGIDSIKARLKAWRGALSEYKAENIWALAEGDKVAIFGNWSGTFKEDFMGMKVAGKSFKIKDVDLFKFNSEGKIIEHSNIQSFGAMMLQLSAAPPK